MGEEQSAYEFLKAFVREMKEGRSGRDAEVTMMGTSTFEFSRWGLCFWFQRDWARQPAFINRQRRNIGLRLIFHCLVRSSLESRMRVVVQLMSDDLRMID